MSDKRIIVNRGNEKLQLKGYNGKTSEIKKFVKNPGGAQIIILQDGVNGKKISTTKHLKWNGYFWSDWQGNKYDLRS